MSSPALRMLEGVREGCQPTLAISGAVLLVCAVLGCLSQGGDGGRISGGPKGEGVWRVARFEITIEPFTNEPAQMVSFSPQTLNVLKWESVFFIIQSDSPKLLEYYGAIGIGPVGKDAQMVSVTEVLPPAVNASFRGDNPRVIRDGTQTSFEWSLPKVTQATPGSCSCSAVLFPAVLEYFLNDPPIQPRNITVKSRGKPDILFEATISGIGQANRVSVVFSFQSKDSRGNRILSLVSASEGWETREEEGEFLIGTSFEGLSVERKLEFSLNVSVSPGLSLISMNQETVTGKKVTSSGIVIESSRSFFGDLSCVAEGFRTERLSYTREAYAFPELVIEG